MTAVPIDVTVDRGAHSLAGSLWLPDRADPRAVVLMHPGSGPSDRDNDVYFPPIRDLLLDMGLATCSFDKRGVGASTGDWLRAGILDQADDAVACAEQIERMLPGTPQALFGHSQGGWVAVEVAARRPDLLFVIVNSGPGVSPAEQERFATNQRLSQRATTPQEFADGARCFELMLACVRNGVSFAVFGDVVQRAGFASMLDRSELFSFMPDNEAIWGFASSMLDHDPRPALRALTVPTLAVFGADDALVPVVESVVAYEASVSAGLLTIAVLAGGDHRVQHGEPASFVDGYTECLSEFVDIVVA